MRFNIALMDDNEARMKRTLASLGVFPKIKLVSGGGISHFWFESQRTIDKICSCFQTTSWFIESGNDRRASSPDFPKKVLEIERLGMLDLEMSGNVLPNRPTQPAYHASSGFMPIITGVLATIFGRGAPLPEHIASDVKGTFRIWAKGPLFKVPPSNIAARIIDEIIKQAKLSIDCQLVLDSKLKVIITSSGSPETAEGKFKGDPLMLPEYTVKATISVQQAAGRTNWPAIQRCLDLAILFGLPGVSQTSWPIQSGAGKGEFYQGQSVRIGRDLVWGAQQMLEYAEKELLKLSEENFWVRGTLKMIFQVYKENKLFDHSELKM